MNQSYGKVICKATGADDIFLIEDIQSLWSGYGKIIRYGLQGGSCERVVVKHVKLPDQAHHPAAERSRQQRNHRLCGAQSPFDPHLQGDL